MASASAEVLPAPTASERLSAFDGTLHHPGIASAGDLLLCPRAGTLDSLNARYADFQERFDVTGEGRSQTMLFRQPRRAFMREVGYGAGQHRWVFEIRSREDIGKYAPDGLTRAHRCVVTWRDAATARLVESGLDLQAVHGVVVGRRPDEPLVVPTAHRLRILPLPSIGHLHADPGIRRLLVEIPDGGPIPPEDLRWAFAGLMAGEAILVPATDDTMVPHYSRPSRRWSSITPVALPSAHRSSPAGSSDPGSAVQRAATEDRARAAVYDALRHAGINARPARVELQQEPWSKGGECAARFAEERRFVPERLWHVRITFDRPIPGPLAIGDGRFLGLGVLAPDLAAPTCFAFQITAGLDPQADARDIAHHLRRAVMARAQQVWGHERLPEALTGHQPDGTPAQDVAHARFLVDSSRGVLFVIVPRRYRRLDRALDGFTDLRAGAAGWLTLQPFLPDTDSDPCLRPAMTWTTLTPYLVERHIRAASTEDAVEHDVREACRREGLPPPEHVVLRGIRSVPGLGVTAAVDLTFAVAVPGPLALGRDRHHGGGFFRARSTT
jgi:CRISPR-associated protein Csb2